MSKREVVALCCALVSELCAGDPGRSSPALRLVTDGVPSLGSARRGVAIDETVLERGGAGGPSRCAPHVAGSWVLWRRLFLVVHGGETETHAHLHIRDKMFYRVTAQSPVPAHMTHMAGCIHGRPTRATGASLSRLPSECSSHASVRPSHGMLPTGVHSVGLVECTTVGPVLKDAHTHE